MPTFQPTSEVEKLAEQRLELKSMPLPPENCNPGVSSTFHVGASATPIHEQESLKPHWNQFVDLLLGDRQKVQAQNLPILESIKEKVAKKEYIYRKLEAKQNEYLNNLTYGVDDLPDFSSTWDSALDKLFEYQEAASVLSARRLAAEKMYERFVLWGKLPVKWDNLSDSEKESIGGDEPPITGSRGPEYAVKAVEILERKPVTNFKALALEMENCCGPASGESKVNTVKRNIGYEDLSREKKEDGGFTLFRKMLTKKVSQLMGEGN